MMASLRLKQAYPVTITLPVPWFCDFN